MVRSHIGLLGGALVTGGLGWWAGARHQQHRDRGETQAGVTSTLPGLPRGAGVSVASRGLSLQVITSDVRKLC